MANALKKKPLVQIEKEKYIEETNRKREEQLKNKMNSIGKKFDEIIVPVVETTQFNEEENQAKTEKKENLDTNIILDVKCSMCGLDQLNKESLKRLSNKCQHFMHNKCWLKLSLLNRTFCITCKSDNINN